MNLKFKTKNLRLVRLLRIDRIIKNQIILEWIDAILFALIVVGIFRTWGYAPYKVPTGSMLQTIQRGDFLFANMHSEYYARSQKKPSNESPTTSQPNPIVIQFS